MKIFVNLSQGQLRYLNTDLIEDVGKVDTTILYGFTLTWKFEPNPRGTCLRRWERFYDERRLRETRVAHLWGSLLVSYNRERSASNLIDAIRQRMETKKTERLVQVAGGQIQK